MAHQLVWSPEAIEDIEAIASYIARDSLRYARVVAAKIVDTAESIPENPGIGRVVPEVGMRNIRERFVYSYRVIYRIAINAFLSSRLFMAAVCYSPLCSA